MGRIGKAVSTIFTRRGSAPARSLVVQIKAGAGEERTAEIYHPPGMASAPSSGDRVVMIRLGNSARRIIVATHNYQLEIDLAEGEVAVYSTNADGSAVASRIDLDNDGNIDLNGSDKRLVTIGELNTALESFQTSLDRALAGAITGHTHVYAPGPSTPIPTAPGVGAAPATSLDISASETTTVRTGG